MSHLILVLNSTALLTGIIVFFVLLILNKKYQRPIIKPYTWFHGILSLEVLYFMVVSYLNVINVKYPVFLTHISRLLDASLIVVIPYFFMHLLKTNPKNHYRLFILVSCIYLLIQYSSDTLMLNHLITIQTYILIKSWVDYLILMPILYTMTHILITIKTGQCETQIRSAIIKALILVTVFLPGIIADIGWFHMKQQFNLIPTGFYFTSVLYLVWNTLFLFDVSHYLITPIGSKDAFQAFCKQFQLSEREQDICSLLLNGLSNASISKHLFIEASTVKKHLQNIFKKTNVSSRFELTQRIQQKGTHHESPHPI